MNLEPNVSLVEVIKKGAFDGTYFRNITLVKTINFTKIAGKNLKN